MELIDAQAEEAEEAAQRVPLHRSILTGLIDRDRAQHRRLARRRDRTGGGAPAAEEARENGLLKLLERWRAEAEKAGHKIDRIAVAFEAGRDRFWLARWLRARGIEAHVIYAASVAVPREYRRAKTDRLNTEQLKGAFLGWLRGERNHCKIARSRTSRRRMQARQFHGINDLT
jgi:hypothetical protein